MNINIRGIKDAGDIGKERIILTVSADDNIGKYIIFNTRQIGEKLISSRVKHTIWLPDYEVHAGDLIVVYTKKSQKYIKEKSNTDETKTVFIYWGESNPIWNTVDAAVALIKIDEFKTKDIITY
ncbi:hypothetical protein HAP94_05020 [Acidithiobacillus ferrivorans]|nr:hypothetical protein [Acidithiobacillus ferrivorans]